MNINSPQSPRHCASIFGAGLPENYNFQRLVYKLRPISHDSNSWECTIVERCNGKSIRKIVETLYLDELKKGAGLVDIGIWKSLFDQSVVATVHELAHHGYICLLPSGESWKDEMPAMAKNICVNGALMEQVERQAVGARPIPIGDQPGGSERPEERKAHDVATLLPSFPLEFLRLLRGLVHAGMCAANNLGRNAPESARR